MGLRVPRASAMAPPRAAIVLAALLAITAIDSRADEDWPGFRGQARQGVGAGAEAPLRWSASEHVRWKTAIPGAGHSSPVVAGDQVFVTTAYESATARQAVRGARGLRLALALLLLSTAFLLPRTGTWWHDTLLAPALAAFVVLAVADDRLLQFERSSARAWLGATVAAVAGLVISAYGDPPAARRRRILALAVAALGAILMIGLPDGLRQSGPLLAAVVAAAAGAGAAGLLVWRGLFAGSRSGHPLAQAAAAIAILAVLVLFRSLVGTMTVGLTIGAVAAGIIARTWLGAWPRLAGPWRTGVLATAILGFAATTILGPRSGWIQAVVAIDRESGRTRWITEGLTAARTAVHHANSMATPTAVAGAGRVIAWFGSPGLMAVDPGGRLLWTNRSVPFQSMYGVGASPVLGAASVLVSSFTPEGAYLAAFDAATGREQWRTPRAAVHAEFGDSRTPLLTTIGGRPTVVAWGLDALEGHDADTGRVLWTYGHDANRRMGSMVASILADGDRLFLPLENGMIALSAAKLAAGTDPVLWTTRGGASALATPVLFEGRIYAVSAAGVATCVDAGSGEILWRQRLAGAYRSSPIAVAGHVYFTDDTGRTTIVAAAPVFRLVAQNDIGEPVVATLAPVDGALYIRGRHHLFRVGP